MGEQRRPLTLEDREEISRCLAMQLTNKEIAVHTGRSESVICREIARNGGREKYRAHRAQSRAEEERCRPKARKMGADPGCGAGWCPVCARLGRPCGPAALPGCCPPGCAPIDWSPRHLVGLAPPPAATLTPRPASSPWILLYPHPGFSRASRRTRAWMFRRVVGLPGPLRMDLAAQRRRTMSRCQRTIVSGVTSSRSPWRRVFGIRLSRVASRARSAQVSFGRCGCRRWSMASWWPGSGSPRSSTSPHAGTDAATRRPA